MEQAQVRQDLADHGRVLHRGEEPQPAAGSARGLSPFGSLIYAAQERINTLPWFASAGASYRGLVPGRDKDTAGFALYYGGFSRDLPGQTYELVFEWT